ncbi:hypothetical protein BC938DRAFT_474803 [Jimgerdemannia flammicorona]|uniref:Uncharacterized protein n=1 Tax=Jimgerdemannia flammicorona TaxID=994334 RepID=A0A433QS77_9FUNG|nr:hypothetical protein BC938DRAFT_474803 [Jimgerdemannia flammicorona]
MNDIDISYRVLAFHPTHSTASNNKPACLSRASYYSAYTFTLYTFQTVSASFFSSGASLSPHLTSLPPVSSPHLLTSSPPHPFTSSPPLISSPPHLLASSPPRLLASPPRLLAPLHLHLLASTSSPPPRLHLLASTSSRSPPGLPRV